MPTTAYQSAYTGTQIDDAIGAVQTAAFVGDDDGTGGVVDSSASLADLTDTNISSPTNGQVLLYDTATSKWVNGNVVTIYSGSTAPSSSTGSNGDIYIQTS